MLGIRNRLKGNKGNGAVFALVGIAFIIAGVIVGLYTFTVVRGQAANPDVPEMFGTFALGIIAGIILVVIGILILFFTSRSGRCA